MIDVKRLERLNREDLLYVATYAIDALQTIAQPEQLRARNIDATGYAKRMMTGLQCHIDPTAVREVGNVAIVSDCATPQRTSEEERLDNAHKRIGDCQRQVNELNRNQDDWNSTFRRELSELRQEAGETRQILDAARRETLRQSGGGQETPPASESSKETPITMDTPHDNRQGCTCSCCDHSEGSDCACDCHATGRCAFQKDCATSLVRVVQSFFLVGVLWLEATYHRLTKAVFP